MSLAKAPAAKGNEAAAEPGNASPSPGGEAPAPGPLWSQFALGGAPSLQGSGKPLEAGTRSYFEPRLGADLGDVRVHSGASAAASTRDLHARAYTLGDDVVFSQGRYALGTAAGQRLLAHELTHVVQQRHAPAAAPAAALEVGRTDTPAEAEADRAAAGVTEPAHAPVGPADVNVGFNPMDRAHRLVEAIDQSQVKDLVVPERHVDFEKSYTALNGLNAGEVKEVEAAYLAFETREEKREAPGNMSLLRWDLFRLGASGFRTDLTIDQEKRLEALMGGTRATSPEDAEAAAENQRKNDAAELWGIFWGKHTEANVERVMAILRRSKDANEALIRTYEQTHTTTFLSGLTRLKEQDIERAELLIDGSHVEADAKRIMALRRRIADIDKDLARARNLEWWQKASIAVSPVSRAQLDQYLGTIRTERKKLVDDILGRLQLAGEEGRALATEPSAAAGDLAAHTRVAALAGGDIHGLATTLGGESEAIVRAIAVSDPGAAVAAQLIRMREDGTLSAAAITASFRALRDQAESEARRRHPDGEYIQAEERVLADEYFGTLKSTWNARYPDGPSFEKLLEKGGGTGAELNKALAEGQGRLDPVSELVFALSGGRKDMETVKRVLRDKSAAEIERLKFLYGARWGFQRSLERDLFGLAPTQAGGYNPRDPWRGYHLDQGKASGTDRLVLEDYMQRAKREGGLDEVMYIVSRAEREYEYTIENRGGTGAWRDWWGNEARNLLDATIKEVKTAAKDYADLVGWDPKTRVSSHPEYADSPRAHGLLHRLRLARATIRGDRAGYEQATAALRGKLQMVASIVIQAVLTAVLSPAAGLIFAARGMTLGIQVARWAANATVSVASTVGSNAIVYGSDYSWSQFKRDVSGGYMGAIGGSAMEKVVGRVAKRYAAKLGTRTPPEILRMANTFGSIEGQAVAEGKSLSEDLSFQKFVEEHLMGKVSDATTAVASRALGGPGPTHAPMPDEARRAGEEARARAAGEAGGPTGESTTTAAGEPDTAVHDDDDYESVPTPMALEPSVPSPPARTAKRKEVPTAAAEAAAPRPTPEPEPSPSPQPETSGAPTPAAPASTVRPPWVPPRPETLEIHPDSPHDNIHIEQGLTVDIDRLLVVLDKTAGGGRIADGIRHGSMQLTFVRQLSTGDAGLHFAGGQTYVTWRGSVNETASTLIHEGTHRLDPAAQGATARGRGPSRLGVEAEARAFEYEHRQHEEIMLQPYDAAERAYRDAYERVMKESREYRRLKRTSGRDRVITERDLPPGVVRNARIAADKAMIEALRADPSRYTVETPEQERARIESRRAGARTPPAAGTAPFPAAGPENVPPIGDEPPPATEEPPLTPAQELDQLIADQAADQARGDPGLIDVEPGQENLLDFPEYQTGIEAASDLFARLTNIEGRKNVAAGPSGEQQLSGHARHEMEGTERALIEGMEAGHTTRPHVFDPRGSEGTYESSHSERKRAAGTSDQYFASSKPLCPGCQRWFSARAGLEQRPQFVGDPTGVHVFMPSGSHIPVSHPSGAITTDPR